MLEREVMEYSNYIQNIYRGKGAFFNHVSLFSVMGMLGIVINNFLTVTFGNVFGTYLELVHFSPLIANLNLVVLSVLGVYLLGAYFDYTNKMFKEDYSLPEPIYDSITDSFIKISGLIIPWLIYISILYHLGLKFIPQNSKLFFIYYSILICSLPFVWTIFVCFSKNFIFKFSYFNPFILLSVINRTFMDIVSLSLKTIIASVFPAIVVYIIIKYAQGVEHQTVKISLKLAALCLSSYFIAILSYSFGMGLVQIAKEKLADL